MRKIVTILTIGAALFAVACTQKEKVNTPTPYKPPSDSGLMETYVPNASPNTSVARDDSDNWTGGWWHTEGRFWFNENGTITDFDGGAIFVDIPARIDGVTVKAIGDDAFRNKDLAHVTFPAGLTSIGAGAFADNHFTTVIIPEGVSFIGSSAFEGNPLTEVSIPTRAFVEASAFSPSGDEQIEFVLGADINFQANNDGLLFAYYEYLCNDRKAGIYINSTISSKREGDFSIIQTKYGVIISWYHGRDSDRLVIPPQLDGMAVKGIKGEFIGVRGISSVQLPDSLVFIGRGAFYNNKLTSITIGGDVTLPENVEYSNHYSFDSSFDGFYSENGRKAGTYVYSDRLINRWSLAVPAFMIDEGDFTIDRNGTITGYSGKDTLVFILTSIGGVTVKAIGNRAFAGKNLVSVSIPANVVSIGDYAFSENSLYSIIIPDNVASIGEHAFSNNKLYYNITIPQSVKSIGDYAFYDNYLSSVTILNGVVSIGNFAFSKNIIESVIIPNSVTNIGNSAFSENRLVNVTIPNSVKNIGDYTFNKNQLTSVTIPNSVVSIGEYAFSSNKLTGVTIPDSVKNIGGAAFERNQLTSVIIGNGITSIEHHTFAYNQLRSIIFPKGITSIGVGAFSNNQLSSVTIPETVTTLGSSAFNYNPLTSVTIPDSVKIMDSYVFGSGLYGREIPGTHVLIDGQWSRR